MPPAALLLGALRRAHELRPVRDRRAPRPAAGGVDQRGKRRGSSTPLAGPGGDGGTRAPRDDGSEDGSEPGRLPAYTNWAAGEPWGRPAADTATGELNFTLDHAPQQCQVNTKCRQKKNKKGKTGNVPRKDRDPTCCGRGARKLKHQTSVVRTSLERPRNRDVPVRPDRRKLRRRGIGRGVQKVQMLSVQTREDLRHGPGRRRKDVSGPGPDMGLLLAFSRLPRSDHLLHLLASPARTSTRGKNADETYAAAARASSAAAGPRSARSRPRRPRKRPISTPAGVVSAVDAPAASRRRASTVVSVNQPPANQRSSPPPAGYWISR